MREALPGAIGGHEAFLDTARGETGLEVGDVARDRVVTDIADRADADRPVPGARPRGDAGFRIGIGRGEALPVATVGEAGQHHLAWLASGGRASRTAPARSDRARQDAGTNSATTRRSSRDAPSPCRTRRRRGCRCRVPAAGAPHPPRPPAAVAGTAPRRDRSPPIAPGSRRSTRPGGAGCRRGWSGCDRGCCA